MDASSEIDHYQRTVINHLSLLDHLSAKLRYDHEPSHRRTRGILDWLALIFAGNDPSNVAATCLQVEPGEITLHVAVKNGTPTRRDRETADRFLTTLRDAFAFPESDDAGRHALFLHFLLRTLPRRIQFDIDQIISTSRPSPQQDLFGYLEELLSQWESRKGKETSPACLDYSEQEYGDREHGASVLKTCLEILLRNPPRIEDLPEGGANDDRDITALRAICQIADVVARSDFCKFLLTGPVSQTFARRLRRLALYNTGAYTFAAHAMKTFHRALGSTALSQFVRGRGGGVIVRWAGDTLQVPKLHAKLSRYTLPPTACLQLLLNSSHQLRNLHKHPLLQSVSQAWNVQAGDAVVPLLHCEVQLIIHLTQHDIKAQDGCIGTTKGVCWACWRYMQLCQSPTDSAGWSFTETSAKATRNWLVPPTAEGFAIAEEVKQKLAGMLKEISEKSEKNQAWLYLA
ncbi:hypothetical protein CERSUDRAFT_66843 [Gelatoporia subvermispora B]|uniref:Uncharacterized protein n=1 Tax=Ceriporiopsis subvermispora (strain B) TaxID=914234 RepID=M2QSI9_CERS8|nr:hypothetical protein CERSUDRAFT_66843 [Gelatoporia subvermispora B]